MDSAIDSQQLSCSMKRVAFRSASEDSQNNNIDDDEDWIQVSDDDDNGEESPSKQTGTFCSCVPQELSFRKRRPTLSIHHHAYHHPQNHDDHHHHKNKGNTDLNSNLSHLNANDLMYKESFRLTQSGTILINGFDKAITTKGMVISPTSTIASKSSQANQIHPHLERQQQQQQQLETLSSFSSSSKSLISSSSVSMEDRLVILGKLGQGASGTVFKVLDLEEVKMVAVKFVSISDKMKRRQMVRELSAFQEHSSFGNIKNEEASSNIVQFKDAFSHIENESVGLIVEYMDFGSLQDIVDGGGCQDEKVLSSIAKQCLLGLRTLHKGNQIHRDIKPCNILINSKGEVKLGDFGISRYIHSSTDIKECDQTRRENMQIHDDTFDKERNVRLQADTYVGTLTYMSPERIKGDNYSFAADIWSLGLSIMATAMGKLPIDSECFWSVWACIQGSESPCLPKNNENHQWSQDLRDFIQLCLTKDHDQRPSADVLLQHPFILSAPDLANFDMVKKQPEQDPKVELTSILESVKHHAERLLEKKSLLCRNTQGLLIYDGCQKSSQDVSSLFHTLIQCPKNLYHLAEQFNLDQRYISSRCKGYHDQLTTLKNKN